MGLKSIIMLKNFTVSENRYRFWDSQNFFTMSKGFYISKKYFFLFYNLIIIIKIK